MASPKKHLKIEGYQRPEAYKYPKKVRIDFSKKPRNRQLHGNFVKNRLEELRNRFKLTKEQDLPVEGVLRDDVVYVEFVSPWGFELKFEQLVDNSANPKYQLLTIRKESKQEDENEVSRFLALVMLKERGVSHFIKRVEKYLTDNVIYKGIDTGNPIANSLISNIEDIKIVTLEAFWTDGITHPFPKADENVWWEVWFRKSAYDLAKIEHQLGAVNAKLGEQKLEFREHVVHLVKATAVQLANSIMLLDCISELRKPQVLNDFITDSKISYTEEREWLDDLLARTRIHVDANEEATLVSIFDSGINNRHPLLAPLVPDANLETWKSAWGVADTEPDGGHGTGMAGLVLFGNLTEALAESSEIHIYHGVESFKVAHPSEKTDPRLYGVIYQDGYSALTAERPNNQRIFCMAVTNDGMIRSGRPSSSSTALDRLIFGGDEQVEPLLFLVSGGNVVLLAAADFPDANFLESIQDPGQAYNAITVGACTFMDVIKDGSDALARYGEMSPFNSTSAAWEPQWPNKPDLVFEGGNQAIFQLDGSLVVHEQLSPVSLSNDFRSRLFIPFNGTSAATALVSKMAAELRTAYPNLWPETIRGLLIHSADWTERMLEGRDFKNNENDRRAILRSVGYGAPNIERAMQSANNSLTLIAEEFISPYRKEGSNIKYNEYHLYELPWPKDILLNEVGAVDTRLTVTLSYYIEPNPNGKEYAKAFSYHSHELDFKMIKSGETLEEFKRRVSAAADSEDNEDDDSPNLKNEPWVIRERVRSKGSIKKDFLDTIGAELHDRNIIAVYPKGGWYKSRKGALKHDQTVRYSLIVSIQTQKQDVDIYTPVESLILSKVEIST